MNNTQKSSVLKYNSQQEMFAALIRHHYTVKELFTRITSLLKMSAHKLSAGIASIF